LEERIKGQLAPVQMYGAWFQGHRTHSVKRTGHDAHSVTSG